MQRAIANLRGAPIQLEEVAEKVATAHAVATSHPGDRRSCMSSMQKLDAISVTHEHVRSSSTLGDLNEAALRAPIMATFPKNYFRSLHFVNTFVSRLSVSPVPCSLSQCFCWHLAVGVVVILYGSTRSAYRVPITIQRVDNGLIYTDRNLCS